MLEEQPSDTIESLYETCSQCLRANARTPDLCGQTCFRLLQQALRSEADVPWTDFYQAFEPWVTSRVRTYCCRYRLSDDLVGHFVNLSYFRYWHSLHGKPEKLRDFQHALNYLRICTRSSVLDSMKNRTHALEQELDTDRIIAPPPPNDDFEKLWAFVEEELADDKDRLLVNCYIVQDLKPKEILDAYPDVWHSTEEIKVAWQRVRRQLRRNYAIRQWFGIDETI